MTTNLSCNLNKVALLRNSRDGDAPDLGHAADIVVAAGAHGLTLHPRVDERHARLTDVQDFAKRSDVSSGAVELNVEGDLRPDLIEAVARLAPHQFTVVPVEPGEKTSHRGWRGTDDQEALIWVVRAFQPRTRISVFVEADPVAVELAAASGARAVEFYTGPYAFAFGTPEGQRQLDLLAEAAETARRLGLRINAGHDLTVENIPDLIRAIRPDEFSIGHALIADALWLGLDQATRRFLAAIDQGWASLG
jgi:pyridoxine 5-phosphate synthase